MSDRTRIPRRQALMALGALAAGAAAGRLGVTDAHAQSAPTFGQNESVQDAMKRLFGGKTIKDGSAVIKLDIPLIAEQSDGTLLQVARDVKVTVGGCGG